VNWIVVYKPTSLRGLLQRRFALGGLGLSGRHRKDLGLGWKTHAIRTTWNITMASLKSQLVMVIRLAFGMPIGQAD
jgi:hypothetical protein